MKTSLPSLLDENSSKVENLITQRGFHTWFTRFNQNQWNAFGDRAVNERIGGHNSDHEIFCTLTVLSHHNIENTWVVMRSKQVGFSWYYLSPLLKIVPSNAPLHLIVFNCFCRKNLKYYPGDSEVRQLSEVSITFLISCSGAFDNNVFEWVGK